jgi:hypothetical protein
MRIDPALETPILQELERAWFDHFPTRKTFITRRVVGSSDETKTIAYIMKAVGSCEDADEAGTTSWHLLPRLCKASRREPARGETNQAGSISAPE